MHDEHSLPPAYTTGRHVRQLVIIGGFFFLFGFITWVNGSLIPYLTIACELKAWQAYLVTFAFYISYTVMAFPSSRLLRYTGMIAGMRAGLLIMALGCLLFIPAALTRAYGLFLLGLFVTGIGLTLLQTAVNPYITVLGPFNKAAQRISIMGICNKFAGMLAPLILGSIILGNSTGLVGELRSMEGAARTARLDQLAHTVILPYIVLAVVLLLVAVSMRYAHLPEVAAAPASAPSRAPASASTPARASALLSERTDKDGDLPNAKPLSIWLGFMAIFVTVGVEVIAGDTIANYGLYHGIALGFAKNLTSFTLGGMIVGYLIGSFAIPRFISQERAFLYSAITGLAVTALVLLVPGKGSVAMVALLGFANALLWPAIWPKALRGFSGHRLNQGSSILIMGIAGGAIMPLLYGWLAEAWDHQWAYLVLIPCYAYDIYYWRKK